jgi:hypothetical protein
MESKGFEWWARLEESLKQEKGEFTNKEIHYFDAPKEHWATYNK